jgi:hypothetical protein
MSASLSLPSLLRNGEVSFPGPGGWIEFGGDRVVGNGNQLFQHCTPGDAVMACQGESRACADPMY